MDWEAIANVLLERAGDLMAIDDKGVIALVSESFATSLGWHRDELEGANWNEVLTPFAQRRSATWQEQQAFRGAIRTMQLVFVSRSKQTFNVIFEVVRVGISPQALLLFVQSMNLIDSPRPDAHPVREYEVEVTSWTLIRINEDAAPRQHEPCFVTLHQRRAPCDDCPLNVDGSDWPRIKASSPNDKEYVVRTATRLGATNNAIVSVQSIAHGALEAIGTEKVQRFAAKANLSPREANILRLLVSGMSIEEIATSAGITKRTVKFHQANLLRKLGVESRLDLVRLLG